MRAILVSRLGGPEVLEAAELDDPVAEPGRTLVDVTAAGVNYADTHRTDGSYRAAVVLPFVPGTEVAGVGPDGRRVVALLFPGGGYASRASVADGDLVEIPDKVDDASALALLVQGLTAWHLLRGSARLSQGETVVVGAASGGVGTVAVQLAAQFGAGRVIAAASTAQKRERALRLGADVAVDSAADGYAERILEATSGRGADVILDSTGGDTLAAALGGLAHYGRLISYGNASRQGRAPVDPGALADRNTSVGGFWLRPALDQPGGFREPLSELLTLVADGRLVLPPGPSYPLGDARRAHEDLLARRTTGKVVLTV
ncbi:quinone oxidoreductase family protein [Actinoplanes derwentensis]|uniref:NADPH2:quinone reductase n=1 Tax=Actinoplanes derwentensis TaxID=113562 RepID=A0A1H2D6X8_9ACTN|nr:NADPH:quinone oxidoreductase family protein [Actinoplanes derwentensis]GID89448.1 NADPH:quinone reductase [Actinoplanes derwentensis]SDT78493.1 NADPH2:quinone reductase [Actinoplanes derwentensis]